MALRILAVCTGNVCRSPLVEQLLRERLLPTEFDVMSAGTQAQEGAAMTESAIAMATRLELRYAQEHRARPLQASDIRRADLVLGLERDHRRQAAEIVPGASRRIVTLREFADIITALPDATPRANSRAEVETPGERGKAGQALDWALKYRGLQPRPADQRELDVLDPYGQAFAVYESSTAAIVDAVDVIAGYFNSVFDSAA